MTLQTNTENQNHHVIRLPRCPACGGEGLVNVQEVEERRVYRIHLADSDVEYDGPTVKETVYLSNLLNCMTCEWSTSVGSSEAHELLGGLGAGD